MTHQSVSLAKGRRPRNVLQSLALLAGMLCVLAGPGLGQGPAPDLDAVVIKVGPVSVTLQEFSNHFHKAARDAPSMIPDRASVQGVLDSRVETLLAQTSTMRDSTVLTRTDAMMASRSIEGIVHRMFLEKAITKYLKADEEVIRAVFDRMSTQLKLAAIKVPTLVELDSVLAALSRGEPFDQVARRLSRDQRSSYRGGEIGWVDATGFSVEQQEILWSLPDGEVSPRFAERQFHAVYRVLDRREGPPLGSIDEERAGILQAIQRNELGRAGQELHDDLMTAYNYRVDMEAAEWMRKFLERETAGVRRTYDPEKDKSFVTLGGEPKDPRLWTEAPLKGEEAARPVAYIDGDTLSALEVIDELVFLPSLTWARFESVTDVTNLCDSAFYYRVKLMEAKRIGLESDPDVLRVIHTQQMYMFWRAYYREKILPEITPDPEEVRAVYEERIEDFYLPERRRFVLVNTPTREQAMQVQDLFRKGLVPSSIVRELGTPDSDFQVTPDTTTGWVTYGQIPVLDPILFRLAEGEVGDPFLDRGRFSVLRLEKKSPAHTQSFESIEADLSRQIRTAREKMVVSEMAAAARKDTEVWIDQNAIGRMDIKVALIEQQRSKRRGR